MPHDAKAIANYFLQKAWEEGQDIDPMKVQKLVYFAHGWYLAIYDEALINSRIQAWEYGPVLPTLYEEFKAYGRGPIRELAMDVEFTRTQDGKLEVRTHVHDLRDNAGSEQLVTLRRFLDRIWEVYGQYSAVQLSNMTHVPEGPWAQVTESSWLPDGKLPKGLPINNQTIRPYFASLRAQG